MGVLRFLRVAALVCVTAVITVYIPYWFKSLPATGEGWVAPGWERIENTFRENLESGAEKGASFAVYYQGKLVAEYSGGYADPESKWTWNKNILTQAYSSSKGVAAVVIATLVDKKLLSYDDPVSKYWPEFSAEGKEKVTVEQLVGHQAGLAVLDEQVSIYNSLDKVAEILAKQKPNWPPGTATGYHTLTFGLYLQELLRRVDPKHRSMAEYFEDEIAVPFGIDFHFGVPRSEYYRTARVTDLSLLDYIYSPPLWVMMYNAEMLQKSCDCFAEHGKLASNHPDMRESSNPSSQGFGTAIGLSKFWGIIANGGKLGSKRLLSKKLVERLQETLSLREDVVIPTNITVGRGLTLFTSPLNTTIIGTPGYGGQMGYADPDHQVAYAYLTNQLSIYSFGDNPNYVKLQKAVYDSLSEIKKKR